jgi:hypothetical protein
VKWLKYGMNNSARGIRSEGFLLASDATLCIITAYIEFLRRNMQDLEKVSLY